MTGVESGSMLTPSALISTETEDGQAEGKGEDQRDSHLKKTKKKPKKLLVFHTGEGGEVRLDVKLFQQHGSRQMDGQITPGLLRQEDVGPGGGTSTAVRGRGLEEDLGWLRRRTAGGDGTCGRRQNQTFISTVTMSVSLLLLNDALMIAPT